MVEVEPVTRALVKVLYASGEDVLPRHNLHFLVLLFQFYVLLVSNRVRVRVRVRFDEGLGSDLGLGLAVP